jgi:hypothetical protein
MYGMLTPGALAASVHDVMHNLDYRQSACAIAR